MAPSRSESVALWPRPANQALTTVQLSRLCALARDNAGLDLHEGKRELVQARIAHRMRRLACATVDEYLRVLDGAQGADELVHFLDAITTNYTSFFREDDHFGLLTELVRQRVAAGQTRLRFWSAGCSSGQEPVSMAIAVAEAVGDAAVDARVLATDVCTSALQVGRAGRYTAESLRRVPSRLRSRWFVRREGADDLARSWAVRPELLEQIAYKRLNLARPPFPMPGPLDAIFCRNVMIYLRNDVRQALLWEFERLLAPHGLLLLGHAETLVGVRTSLGLVGPAAYSASPSLDVAADRPRSGWWGGERR